MCISLLKPLTRTCRHWKLYIAGACILDMARLYCVTPPINILQDHRSFRFKARCLSMLSTLTHSHSTPSILSEHFSSVFSQWCRIKLRPQRRQHRGGLSFLRFLGPTSKTRRLELGNSEQLESLFNYVCGYQACHQCVTHPATPSSNPRVLSSQGKLGSKMTQMILIKMYVGRVSEQLLVPSHQAIEGQVKLFNEMKRLRPGT